MTKGMILLAIALGLALAACGGTSQQAAVVMTVQAQGGGQKLPEQVAADAQSTLNAIQIAQNATAQAAAQQTAVAAQATGQAADQATSVAMATHGAATATTMAATVVAEALQVTQTVQAMEAAALAAQATATAAPAQGTATAAAQATTDAQAAANIAMLQADTQAKLQAENERYAATTGLIKVAAGALILVAFAFASALVIRLMQLRGQPVIRLEGGAAHLAYDLMGRPRLIDLPALGPGRQATLPAPAEAVALLPEGQPVRELPAMPAGNVLIVGPTRTGKSTALRQVVKTRQGQVVVIDPHYRPGAWGAQPAIVGSRDYDEVTRFLMWLGSELDNRRQRRATNDVDFNPLTVVLDELPNLADEIEPEALTAWRRVARQGSKYGLFVVVGSQSTRVKTMGIQGEGDVLENFRFALYLGKAAIEKDKGQADLGNRAALLLDAGRPVPVKIPYNPAEDPDHQSYRPSAQAAANLYQAQAQWNGGRGQAQPDGQQQAAARNGSHSQTAWQPQPPGPPEWQPEAEAPAEDPSQVIILPARMASHAPHDLGMVTPWGFVPPTQVEEILAAWAADWSGRATEIAAFGYAGGSAYRMTTHVIDAYRNGQHPLPSPDRLQAARGRLQRRVAQQQQYATATATATAAD